MIEPHRPSILHRLRRCTDALPIWISIPLFYLIIFLAVLLAIPLAFLLLIIGFYMFLFINDAWGHNRLAHDLTTGDFVKLSTANIDYHQPQPPFNFVAPNRAWSLNAVWNKKGFYDWNLVNQTTNQHFERAGSQEDMDCGGPVRLSAIWSPDSRYVAVTTFDDHWRVKVIDLEKSVPVRVESPSPSPFDRPELVPGMGDSIQEVQARALDWKDKDTLRIVIYVRSYSSQGPTDFDGGSHLTFRLNGPNPEIIEVNDDFHEEFSADL